LGRPSFWHTQEDGSSSATNPHDAFGLKRRNGTQKPSFNAYKEAVADASKPVKITMVVPAEKTMVTGETVLAAVATGTSPVSKVEFYTSNLALLGTGVNYLGWNLGWNTRSVPDGPYSIVARAHYGDNKTSVSAPLSVYVNNTKPPKPAIVVPAPTGNTVIRGSKVVFSASSEDPDQVPWMWYYMDNKEIGTAVPTRFGYLLEFDSTSHPNEVHSFHLKAQYRNGYTFTSPAVKYNIQN
jgi:hypothetical protein